MSKKVLVVDDRADNRYLIKTILESEGWSVDEAESGEEALIKARANVPDLAISDILMPGMDGYSLCRIWKHDENLQIIPFLFCTATFTNEKDKLLADKLGADDFLTQPVSPDDLVEHIDRVCRLRDQGKNPRQPDSTNEPDVSETYATVLSQKLDHKVADYRETILALQESRAELDKQLKHLTCLHELQCLLSDPTIHYETMCQEASNELADALGGEEAVAVRVRVPNRSFQSPGFTDAGSNLGSFKSSLCDQSIEVFARGLDALSSDDEVLVESVARQLEMVWRRQRRESELQDAHDRLKLLQAALEAASHSVVITSIKGEIEWVNPAFEKTTGYSASEVVGKNPRVLKSGKQDPELYRNLWATISKGKVWHGDFVNRRKDGTLYDEQASITPVKDSSGMITHYVAIKQDVTKQHELEARALRSQRMESIGLLAGGVAHDLNNVLAPITMSIELLERDQSKEDRKAIVEVLLTSCQRGAGIIRQVLTFARGVEGKRVVLQARHFVKDMVKISSETFPKNISIERDIAADLWLIEADVTQLHQVLLNLAVNARDAMRNGGTLKFVAENHTLSEPLNYLNQSVEPGRYVRFQVSDSGSGIPSEKIDRIFEPFFTTKPQGEGTGLGLPTSLGIVRSHRGLIKVDSEPGKSTVFTVLIPAVESGREEASDDSQTIPRGNGETILIVDDEKPIRLVNRRMLNSYGYQVMEAENGAEAVALYATNRDKIDLLFTDVMMPVMDGVALVKAIRSIDPEARFVCASGFVGESSGDHRLAQLKDAGVGAILEKPFSGATLARAIASALEVN